MTMSELITSLTGETEFAMRRAERLQHLILHQDYQARPMSELARIRFLAITLRLELERAIVACGSHPHAPIEEIVEDDERVPELPYMSFESDDEEETEGAEQDQSSTQETGNDHPPSPCPERNSDDAGGVPDRIRDCLANGSIDPDEVTMQRHEGLESVLIAAHKGRRVYVDLIHCRLTYRTPTGRTVKEIWDGDTLPVRLRDLWEGDRVQRRASFLGPELDFHWVRGVFEEAEEAEG